MLLIQWTLTVQVSLVILLTAGLAIVYGQADFGGVHAVRHVALGAALGFLVLPLVL